MPTIIRNGITYGGSVGGGNTSNNYSTEEQAVGTWIDGKPIYRKTFQLETELVVNAVNSACSEIPIDITNVDRIINVMAYQNRDNFAVSNCMAVKMSDKRIGIWAINTMGAQFIVIEYTKTTD